MTVLHDILHVILYYLARPIARRLPEAGLEAVWRVLALPMGLSLAAVRGSTLRRYLALVGDRDRPLGTTRTAVRIACERLRRLNFYLRDGRVAAAVEGLDDVAAARPTVWIALNTVGLEGVIAFLDRSGAVIVRRRWGGEGEVDVRTARPWRKWSAHKAALRSAAGAGREVIVGEHAIRYRRMIDGTRHVVVYQDVWDERDRPPLFPFFGQPTALRFGAPRLAELGGGMPLRFLSVDPDGGRWVLRAGGEIAPTADAIRRRIEAEIRRDPAHWGLWPEWLAYLDRRAGLAVGVDVVAAKSLGEVVAG